ncbi:NUDIX domain-containing protein [Candidatus Pacearchaeota archaeon]|nr:NUDIX domain-containing protein [Candidatus Pacearchaeota archaeon]
MPPISAGILLYRLKSEKLEVFLAHPGGPFWKDKDLGAWTIPKGEIEKGEDLLETAKREFKEETGIILDPKKNFIPLGQITQKSGKIVHAWAIEGDWSGLLMGKSFVELEWPMNSGKKIKFSEIDKASFFPVDKAMKKINPSQAEFIERLEKILRNKTTC